MSRTKTQLSRIEPLEARIAPAAVFANPIDAKWRAATVGSPVVLHAGEGLSTLGDKAGSYLLFVEQGNVMVFTTDFNNNNLVDTNEITGLAAGDGLRLISFVDIHGDIVTNLVEKTIGGGTFLTLSDSDRNPTNDDPRLQGDGRVILPKTIEKIEFRPLAITDIPDQDGVGPDDDGDGVIDSPDAVDLAFRTVPWSSYSIFGSIIAGGGFGADDGGLLLNPPEDDRYIPTVDAIYTGSATSGKFFSFGVSSEYVVSGFKFGDDVNGVTGSFIPTRGQAGASINTVKGSSPYNIGTLQAGNGGSGAPGGSILNVTINGDNAGGYNIIAGDGGDGPNGGNGGSITNFSDLGSVTGFTYISTGSGGFGATGRGGSGGDAEFGPMSIRGDVHIDLGDGATGFSAGGNGASLSKVIFSDPPGVVDPITGAITDVPVRGTNGFGTTHYPDSSIPGAYNANNIGTHMALDFDGDGIGDFVYITGADPTNVEAGSNSALVVLLGAPPTDPAFPGYRTLTAPDGSVSSGISLNGPRNPKALATGDLNGDGHPDIVVGSTDPGGSGDLMVFLAKFEDVNNDGVLVATEDLNRNGTDDFIGFWEARHSTLPIVGSNSMSMEDLTIGDFDGNGRPEIVVATNSNLVFLTADMEKEPVNQRFEYTGQFFADFGTKAVRASIGGRDISVPAVNYTPYVPSPGSGAVLEASPLSSIDSTHDVVFATSEGGQDVLVIEWTEHSAENPVPTVNENGPFGVGIPIHDFTVADIDNDGDADLYAISNRRDTAFGPFWSLEFSRGNGLGLGISGFSFGGFSLPLHSIRSMDVDGDGNPGEALVLDQVNGLSYGILVFDEFFPEFAEVVVTGILPTGIPGMVLGQAAEGAPHPTGFVDSRPIFVGRSTATITAADSISQNLYSFYVEDGEEIDRQPLVDYSLSLHTGAGGNSLHGRGGASGFLGGKAILVDVVDPVTGEPVIDPATGKAFKNLVGAVQLTALGPISLVAEDGGEGFSSGGVGGFIAGVTITGGSAHSLIAGNGGRGVSGAGGAGGSLLSNSIESLGAPVTFRAGDGGVGRIGGTGGSVVGNGTGIFDTLAPAVDVFSGAGGLGTRGGGNAGTISGFSAKIVNPGLGAPSYLNYVGANGGDTVFGKGGDGGSIVNSSPQGGTQLGGDINIKGGDGGKGATGGAGGSITAFVNRPDGSSTIFNPGYGSFLGGTGGNGTSASGGRGGSVSGIETPTLGDPAGSPSFYRFVFSRIIAGAGGTSSSAKGGDGGDVANVITSSQLGSWVLVGGAGGQGLFLGGKGGSVTNASLTIGGASTFSKGLFVGGAGGNAGAFIPNIDDATPKQFRNQFGGRIGRGGDGGNVVGIVQENGIAAHIDLIAGDGGDTIHYGTPFDKPKVSYVGKGGSIRDIRLAGEAGNMDPAIGIKSYNNIFAGESVDDFVRNELVNPAGLPAFLTDSVGNVGVIVGAAGRNKSVILDPVDAPTTYRSLPARFATNGSLENFTARNLMSAVAGSVDRIASIQLVKGLNVAQQVGVDKLGGDFLDEDLAPTVSGEPVIGGRNINGAIIAKQYVNLLGASVPPPQNGFIR